MMNSSRPLLKATSSDRLHKSLNKSETSIRQKDNGIMTKSAIITTSTPKVDVANRNGTSKHADTSVRKTLNLNSFDMSGRNGDDSRMNSFTPNNTDKDSVIPTANSSKIEQGTENNIMNDDSAKARNYNNQNGTTVTREITTVISDSGVDVMSSSMIAKNKINTEEEAKAALAERRRLAREEAERLAELERQRIENERLAEEKRLEEEAENQRRFEEEAIRLAEEQRRAENERLRQAIEVYNIRIYTFYKSVIIIILLIYDFRKLNNANK